MFKDGDLTEVEPVQHIESEDRHQDYTYANIKVVDIPDEIPWSSAELRRKGGYIVYQYSDNSPIFVDGTGVYRLKGSDRKQGEKDCYHFLSWLDSRGLVSRFIKDGGWA